MTAIAKNALCTGEQKVIDSYASIYNRSIIRGLPEWYKDKLLQKQFGEQPSEQ